MKFFLDSAIIDEIEYALDMWNIDGVTTNPRHINVSGKPFMTAIKEIAAVFAGTDKPVSVEVNPHHDNWHGGTDAHQMQKQGKGAYVTTIGAPSAFMHWANGLADKRDIQAVTDLLAVFAEKAHEMGVSTDPWVRVDG